MQALAASHSARVTLRFSGIEGLGLGLKRWVRIEFYCECNKAASQVLNARMRDGNLTPSTIWSVA